MSLSWKWGVPLLAAILGVVVTRTLIGSFGSEPQARTLPVDPILSTVAKKRVSGSSSPRYTHSSNSKSSYRKSSSLASNRFQEWIDLRVEQPELASAITNTLVAGSSRRASEKGVSGYNCNRNGNMLGKYVLEFMVHVESSATQLQADGWQFLRVRTGSLLTTEVIHCFEQVLGAESLTANDGTFPDGFSGNVSILYRIEFREKVSETNDGT